MTVHEIIKQTEAFTTEQKQQLGYYFLISTLKEDKRDSLMQLFYNINLYTPENFETENTDNKLDNNKKQRKLGFLKGVEYYIADDFDAPLDDLKDYM